MELQYKTTVWVSMKFPDEVTKEEIIERLEKGEMPLDIGNKFDCEVIDDTEEFITPEENEGQSTIELTEFQEGKLGPQIIWDNSFESELERKQNEQKIKK